MRESQKATTKTKKEKLDRLEETEKMSMIKTEKRKLSEEASEVESPKKRIGTVAQKGLSRVRNNGKGNGNKNVESEREEPSHPKDMKKVARKMTLLSCLIKGKVFFKQWDYNAL